MKSAENLARETAPLLHTAAASHAHGPFWRLVFATTEAAELINAIERWLEIVGAVLRGLSGEAREAAWQKYERALSNRMQVVCDQIWPRKKAHPVLYSARHCFAALTKMQYSPAEVAALMGHLIDTTAFEHYSRPPRGGEKMPFAVMPSPHRRDIRNVKRGRVFDPEIISTNAAVRRM